MNLSTLDQIEAAAQVVYHDFQATPQYRWGMLSERLGTDCWVKHENHTPVGAFKIRGGLTYFDCSEESATRCRKEVHQRHARQPRPEHRLGRAGARRALHHRRAARQLGRKKRRHARAGRHLIEHGDEFQEAREFAIALATERGAHMVPSFHPELVLGVSHLLVGVFQGRAAAGRGLRAHWHGLGRCAAIAAKLALGHKAKIVGVVSSQRHHLRRLDGRWPRGRSAGNHRAGRRHGLPHRRPEPRWTC